MSGITSTKKIKGQPHLLAYITPGEAKTLENLGGQKTMTKEGIFAYPPGMGDPNYDGGGGGTYSGSGGNTTNSNNQNTGNDNNDIQRYMDDETNYLVNNTVKNPSISDDDRDRFFAARPDYKAAADQAAKAKAKQQEEAKKEKDRIDEILAEHRDKEPVAYSYGKPIKNYKKNYFTGPNKFSTATKMRQLALKNLIDKKMGIKSTRPSFFEMGNFFNPKLDYKDKLGNYLGTDYTYNSGITTDMMGANLQNYFDMDKYGMTGKNLTDIDRMNRALDEGRSTGEITQTQYEDAFNNQNINTGGGGGQTILPYPYNVQQPGEEEDSSEDTGPKYRFGNPNIDGARNVTDPRGYYADGGIMGTRARKAFGGIMDRVTGRKAYGLGSIFKSVKKAVGKVLKSPIGKAALMYAGGVYLGGGNIFSASAYNPANFLGSKASGGYFANMGGGLSSLGKKIGFGKLGPNASFGDKAMKFGKNFLLGYGLTKTKLGEAKPNEGTFSDRGGNLIDPLTGEESIDGGPSMRANIELAKLEANGDPDKLAAIDLAYNNMLNLPSSRNRVPYEGYKNVAEGGRIGRAEGGLMDLGGMEKDYRAEGGFVPIGEYEKKDDVPARLSVNEFVMTADAVRGAGQGDIDKGAEVMENMMKNLENGGTVSKESQGNTGAQDMFSVSQRLGEVI